MDEDEEIERDDEKAECLRIISSLQSQFPNDGTRVMTYYILGMRSGCYPHATVKFLIEHTGGKKSTVYTKLNNMEQGFGYDYNKKRTALNPEESAQLYDLVVGRNSDEHSMTFVEITQEANEITRERREQINRPPISVSTIRNWTEKNGLLHKKALSNYEMKALSCRIAIATMYQNLHNEMALFNYPPKLIFNMDESWVSTEGKVMRAHVVCTKDGEPTRKAATISAHVTLIGCVSLDGQHVKPTYLVPHELQQAGMVAKYHLEDVKYFVQSSGFISVDNYVRWLKEVLVPHIEAKRDFPGQMALLIVDPHSTRTHAKVKKVLFENNIRELLLPASVTSVFQPLDKVVFSVYKNKLRENATNGAGGVYAFLYYSISAYQVATTPMNIDASWKRSKLFAPDYEDVIATFREADPSPTNGVRSNIVLGPTYETSDWQARANVYSVCFKQRPGIIAAKA